MKLDINKTELSLLNETFKSITIPAGLAATVAGLQNKLGALLKAEDKKNTSK